MAFEQFRDRDCRVASIRVKKFNVLRLTIFIAEYMQRELKRDSLVGRIRVEGRNGGRIGFVVEEVQWKCIRPEHLLNRVMVNNRLLLLMRMNLELLRVA